MVDLMAPHTEENATMLIFYPLALTDTMLDLVRRSRADAVTRASTAYREAMSKAKTNMDVLVAQGVISYDDGYGEMCASYAWDSAKKRAEREGVSHGVAAGRNAYESDATDVRDLLEHAALHGETAPERAVRVRAAKDAAPRGVRPNGAKCKHNSTQKERGWTWEPSETREDAGRYTCWRCNTRTADIPHSSPTPTDQAQIASALFHNEQAMATRIEDADTLTAEECARYEARRAAARIDAEIAAGTRKGARV